MTPAQVEEYSRNRYNAINDTFWSSTEILKYIYDAAMELSRETLSIERTYTSTTVASTQAYDFPTTTMAIKRVTWDGKKLTPMSMREDDAVTGLNMTTTDTGNPEYYWIWDNAIYLRPIPASAATLKLWTYNFPDVPTATSTLEVPTQFHLKLCNYVNQQMALKDQNYTAARYYGGTWQKDIIDIKKWMKMMKRMDGFTSVKDENLMVETYIA